MENETQGRDGELLRRSLGGDSEAFATLYRRRQGPIFRFALHMSGSQTVAEDVTQEVFLALLREGSGYQEARGSVAAYLFGVARKQVLRALSKTRGAVTFDLEGDEEGLESTLAASEDLLANLTRQESIEAVRCAVLLLPGPYREVVALCDLEEVSYEAAAEALGCAVGTIRSRLNRGRRLLWEKLQRERRTGKSNGKPWKVLA